MNASRFLYASAVLMFFLSFLSVGKGWYHDWYSLHDATWSNIAAGESAMNLKQYVESTKLLEVALDKAYRFESQRIFLPIPQPALRDPIICCLGDLGKSHELQGHHTEARNCYERRLARSEQLYGRSSIMTYCCLESLLDIYKLQGNYAEAEPIFKRLMRLRTELPEGSWAFQKSHFTQKNSGFLRVRTQI